MLVFSSCESFQRAGKKEKMMHFDFFEQTGRCENESSNNERCP